MPALKHVKARAIRCRDGQENDAGDNEAQGYKDAVYKSLSDHAAAVNASRLLKNAEICARIAEVRAAITAGVIKSQIANRGWRILQLVRYRRS